MTKKSFPVCLYLLRTAPEIVKKLPRNDHLVTTINDEKSRLVMFGGSESLRLFGGNTHFKLEDIKIIVPEGIDVYRVVKKVRNFGGFLFSVRKGNDNNRAYFSELCNINSLWQIGSKIEKNVADLFSQPSYSHEKSSEVFNRLLHSGSNTNLYLKYEKIRIGRHPFAEK